MTKKRQESGENIRELVLEILLDVLEKNQYSSGVISGVLTKYQYLDKQERGFLTRLSEGTIERMLELDYIIDCFSKVKTGKMKPVIRNILRMAVYQMKYMEQVPDSAACNEAVKLAIKKGFINLKGFVNGVLRGISRNLATVEYPSKEEEPVAYLSVVYSMPRWIVEMWLKNYDYLTVKQMLLASLEERNTCIRCNLNKTSVDELKEDLERQGILVEEGNYLPYAMNISNYNYITSIPNFLEGEFFVQDESSMMVAEAAGVKENDVILDVCAAPGGKSLHVAEKLKNTGKVISRDISEYKVSLIKENASRLNISNMQIEVQDALQVETKSVGMADVVIADLPCSGLGVIGKKPDIKYKMKSESCKALSDLQKEILSVVQQYVKKDGVFIFSTCTIQNSENEENVRWFIENFPFQLESLVDYLPESLRDNGLEKGYVQFLPGIHKTDGFFLARFRRREA